VSLLLFVFVLANPNPKPGFAAFQTRKPGFGKDVRVCKP